ncbi:hypothetical protein TKK_0001831 [Trichogramma kaykai]|uniref:Uncharacterized protein n=1 Tax=Trichogramma kaykai TaxID=54128 RepID=A0ABD2XEQ0_9HYME
MESNEESILKRRKSTDSAKAANSQKSSNERIENVRIKGDDVKQTNYQKSRVSLKQFVYEELTRNYELKHDEERYSARREKIYSFIKIPKEAEIFMWYGFLQCADSFLYVYTFLPIRFVMALWALITRPFKYFFTKDKRQGKDKILRPAEICDLLKGIIVVCCWILTWEVDTSMMYHLVKSQSVIKLYIFYNMLEVGDRLFSAFGQDAIDALLWTATESKTKHRFSRTQHLGTIPHLFFALIYVLLHSILVLFQATTLNVAINSSNKALLTIMMSNNFVELKGSVFKKFDKKNFFQLSCSDVRERFHLTMLLLVVTLQTMKEYAWHVNRLAVLLPDCILLLFAELLVDWVKHAFIARFNELRSNVYKEFSLTIAYDMAQTRQEAAFSDPSDLVARRMGFIPLPLGVAIARVLCTTLPYKFQPVYFLLLILAFFILVTLRVLISMYVLGCSYKIIKQHNQSTTEKKKFKNEPIKFTQSSSNLLGSTQNLDTTVLSNSSMSLNNVFLNDMFLKKESTCDINLSEDSKLTQSDHIFVLSEKATRAGSEPLLPQ